MPREKLAPELPGVSLSPDLVWSSWMAGAAPGRRSYVSVMMRS